MKAGWEVKPLGEVCSFENGDRGKNYPGKKCFVASGVPFINAGLVDDGEVLWDDMNFIPEDRFELLSRGKIQSGDFLFCLRGSLGKFGHYVSDRPAAIASSLVIIRPNDEVLPSFFAYYLRSAHCASEIERLAAGAAQPNLGANDLKTFSIPIPPLEEQKRIVAVLDAAFEGLTRAKENAEANLQNARELFELTRDNAFSDVGAEWRETTVGEICERVEYGSSEKSQKSGKIPVLRMGNIQRDELDWSDLVFTDNEVEAEKLALKAGDVLFNRTNSAEHVGKTAIYRGERPAIFAGYLIRLHYKVDEVHPEYLNLYLNGSAARSYGKKVMSRSVNQANINGTKLKQYPIRLPSLLMQRDVADDLLQLRRTLDEVVEQYTIKLTDIADLRQSLLQKAFAGELT